MAPCEHPDQEVHMDKNLKEKFLQILKSNEIHDEVNSITMKVPGALKGQHLTSTSFYIQIQFKDSNLKPKNIFVKKLPDDNPKHSSLISESRVMEKETQFLKDFVKDAMEFCQKYPGCENFFDMFPKCLYGDDKMVVLENLVLDQSFTMLPKEDFQDLETAKIVLTNLARFHATTKIILVEMGRENFETKYNLVSIDPLLGSMRKIMVTMLDDGINTIINIHKANPIEGSDYALEMLNKYAGKGSEIFTETLKVYPEDDAKFLCLNHGDCWNNNLLFKLDSNTGKAYEHKFVDLQITRLGSPCYDLIYYIYFSVKFETRQNHLPELLRHYFDMYKGVWEAFGKQCPFNYDELVKDFKRRNLFGVLNSLSFLAAVESMKYLDVTKMGENPEDMAALFKDAIDKFIQINPSKATTIAQESIIALKNYFLDLVKF